MAIFFFKSQKSPFFLTPGCENSPKKKTTLRGPSPLAFCFGGIFTTWCPKESIMAHTEDIVKINTPKVPRFQGKYF
jgi:hypothetical protein